MKDIEPILQSLGFLDSEVKTYLASLQNGPSTVLELTKTTNLSRQATYVVIEELTKRGLMSSVLRGKKRYYVAENPDKLLFYAQRKEGELKDRLRDLENILPELKLQVGGEKPIVKLFEGKEGYRTVINDLASSKPTYLDEIIDVEAKKSVIDFEESRKMLAGLRKSNTKSRALVAGIPRGTTIDRTRYYLPKEQLDFKSCITIYDNKIAMFTYEGKMHSILIESDALARAMSILFDRAFKGSQDLKTEIASSSSVLELESEKENVPISDQDGV